VLFIYSKKDHLVPFELMDQLFQKAKTKKMIFIDDSHFPNRNVELIAYHFSRAFIRDDFEALTPYGPNFRFYNKITKLTNKDIEGEMAFGKKLTKGHFVDVELVPGMFLIESAAQISSVLIRENIFQHEKYHVLLHKIGDVRFMKALKPEEKIRIRSELVSIEGPDYKVSCSIHHGGDIIAKMDMIAFCIPKEVLQKSLR
jgi:3-hydroxymyristoyl/3-hydroxydecanoyl-(acyl carrier protein) dehydratase